MKKAVAFFCALLLVLLPACGKTPGAAEQNSDTNTGGNAEQTDTLYKKVDFKAKYVSVKYTDKIDDKKFPEQLWITSLSELRDYQKENAEKYGLNTTGDDTDFIRATKDYDKEFFEKHNLIFLVVQEGSSTIRYKVTEVIEKPSQMSKTPYNLQVNYDVLVPEMGDCDRAPWIIIIELDKKYDPTSCTLAEPKETHRQQETSEKDDYDEQIKSGLGEIDFKAKYLRTEYVYSDGENFPELLWITSPSEIEDYYADKHGLDSTGYKTDFVNATKGYDNSFFEKHNLIFLSLQESSSSIKHKVTKVKSELSHLSSRPVFYDLIIFYDRIVPEVYTCDMAQWLIMIEVDKKYGPESSQIFCRG